MNNSKKYTIVHVGGEDVRMRIPMLSLLLNEGVGVGAIGSSDGDAFKNKEIPYYNYYLKRWITPFSDVISRYQLSRIFKSLEVNLVHAFDTKPGVLVPVVAKKSGVPFVIRTVTGMGYVYSGDKLVARLLRPFYRLAQKRANRSCDLVIFQNNDDKHYFESRGLVERKKSVLIQGSGIDTSDLISKKLTAEDQKDFRSRHKCLEKTVVTMVARLVKNKGVIEFLEAAKYLSGIDNLRFVLIGPIASEGSQAVDRSTIEQYSEYVDYIGPVNNVIDWFSISDVVVLPSYYREGLPRVLLEAGALGLPIVTTDMPGCRDVVKDGWNGYLVPIKDSNALAEAIKKLTSDKDKRQLFGQRSYEYVKENYDISIVFEQLYGLYSDLLEGVTPKK